MKMKIIEFYTFPIIIFFQNNFLLWMLLHFHHQFLIYITFILLMPFTFNKIGNNLPRSHL